MSLLCSRLMTKGQAVTVLGFLVSQGMTES